MRFCPYCGASVEGDDRRRFCAGCGEPLHEQPGTSGAPAVGYRVQIPAASWPTESLASLNARVVAWAVDALVLGSMLWVLAAIGEALAPEPRYGDMDPAAPAWVGLAILVLAIGYPSYFEGAEAGQTPGMRLLRLRVIRYADGRPLGILFGLVRTASLIGNLFGIGLLTALGDKNRRTLRDHIAGTIVVRADRLPPEAWPGELVWDGRTAPQPTLT